MKMTKTPTFPVGSTKKLYLKRATFALTLLAIAWQAQSVAAFGATDARDSRSASMPWQGFDIFGIPPPYWMLIGAVIILAAISYRDWKRREG
jgi:hypothetical protein